MRPAGFSLIELHTLNTQRVCYVVCVGKDVMVYLAGRDEPKCTVGAEAFTGVFDPTVRNRAGELVMFCLFWAKVCAYGPHFFFF